MSSKTAQVNSRCKTLKKCKKFEIRYKGRFQGNVQSLSDFLFFKIFKIFRFLLFSFDDMISQENSYGLSFRKYLLYIGILRIYGSWQKAKFLQVTSYESYNLWPKTWRFKVFYCKSIIIIENNYNWKVWPCSATQDRNCSCFLQGLRLRIANV